MRISIIVPTLNEECHIVETLTALKKLEGDPEIIVVDGGSTDHTAALAEEQNVSVLRAERGRGHQMHAGAQRATGDVLWFVHADTIPPPDATLAIGAALANKRVAAGNFGLVFDGESRAARQLTAVYPFLRLLNLCYGDSGIFVRREVYDRIGGFRPLALFEDLDLLRRLRRVGKFVHLRCRILTSSRRFEHRNFAMMWLQWTTLQLLYWFGCPPDRLARWYRHARRTPS